MVKSFAFGLCGAVLATVAVAEAPVETGKLDGRTVTLHVQPFLNATELSTLRLVMTNRDALKVFVTNTKDFAALAMAPNEGFIRDGGLVESAKAVGGAPDAATAAADALASCDATRKKNGKPCVVVLEVGPTG